MQRVALSASQSEVSFSLGSLSLHYAGGLPLTHITQPRPSPSHPPNPTHTRARAHTNWQMHKLFLPAIYHYKNKKEALKNIWQDDNCFLLSFLVQTPHPPLRFNLNVKWDWLDYGGVKSEDCMVRGWRKEAKKRRGTLKYTLSLASLVLPTEVQFIMHYAFLIQEKIVGYFY